MPTPRALSERMAANSRSTSSAGRLAVGSSSTRKSQSTAKARAMATSDFSVRLSDWMRVSGSRSQPTRLNASRAAFADRLQSMAPARPKKEERAKPRANPTFSATVIHSIRPRS